jgi:hypothetical protein
MDRELCASQGRRSAAVDNSPQWWPPALGVELGRTSNAGLCQFVENAQPFDEDVCHVGEGMRRVAPDLKDRRAQV